MIITKLLALTLLLVSIINAEESLKKEPQRYDRVLPFYAQEVLDKGIGTMSNKDLKLSKKKLKKING